MKEKIHKHPYSMCWFIFAICGATRIVEYYLIRTDKTIIAENFVHKLLGIGYVILAGLMGIKWGLLYKMTGSLWVGLGDHLFNNVIAANLVHVTAGSESDSMQIVRIVVAQLLSSVIVLFAYRRHMKVRFES